MTIKYIKPKLPNRGHSGAIEMTQEKIYPESDVSLFFEKVTKRSLGAIAVL
jgi:hypothetical protein